MALLFRSINNRRWDAEIFAVPLAAGDVPADPLGDLRTTGNRLSVWCVEDKSYLNRVAAAFATTRSSIDKMDYVLFRVEDVERLAIRIEQTEGGSADDEVNRSSHRDLVDMTGFSLARLVTLLRTPVEKDRYLPKRLKGLIATGMERGEIDEARLKQAIKTDMTLFLGLSPGA